LLLLISVLYSETVLGALSVSETSRTLLVAVPPQRLAQNWDELSPRERARALENYKRFQKLPPERRQNLEEKYNQWMQLPNEEKSRIQKNYDRYRKMDSDQKEEFQRKYKTWQSNPR
jgi:hypothetical protein